MQYSAEDLSEILEQFEVMSAPINDYQQLFSHPQVATLDMITEFDHPSTGKSKFLRPPWKLYGVPRVNIKPYSEPHQKLPANQ